MAGKSSAGTDLGTVGGRIRWAIRSFARVSEAEFARRLQVKHPVLSRWINDPKRPPNEESLKRIASQAGVSAAWLRYGEGPVPQPPAANGAASAVRETRSEYLPDIPTPDYESLGIDVHGREELFPAALRLFDRFMVELLARGVSSQGASTASRWLLGPMQDLDTQFHGREGKEKASEEDQVLVIEGTIPVIRELLRKRGYGI